MVDLTPIEGKELSVDVLDLQALSTPSALAADELGALGNTRHYEHHDCDDDDDQNVAAACLLVTTALTVF